MDPPTAGQASLLDDISVTLLSGERVDLCIAASDTVSDLKGKAAVDRGVPARFLRILRGAEELAESTTADELRGCALHLHVLGSVPFREAFVKELAELGARVLVDGVLATYSMKAGSWGSSSKFRLDFDPPGHPELGTSFQVKDWMIKAPGVFEYRNCCKPLHMELLAPQADANMPTSLSHFLDPVQSASSWHVDSSAWALVRAGPLLASVAVDRLPGGTELAVVRGAFLDDADRTPRLQLVRPVAGWITPYLHSSQKVLARPSEEAAAAAKDSLSKIVELIGAL